MDARGLTIGLLGPIEVRVDDAVQRIGGPLARALLARLATADGAAVSVNRLAEELWDDTSRPATAEHAVRVYASRLRRVVGDRLASRSGGYALRLGPDELDARAFAAQARAGRAALDAGDAESAVDTLVRALALWRGRPLADLERGDWARGWVEELEELRARALEDRVEAELALGRHAGLVPELERLVDEHPLHEAFRRQLMLALFRSGRQADALAVYHDARRALREELGLEPGPELRALEAAILRQDASLRVEPAEVRRRRRLPAPVTPLVGRRREVDEVTALLRGPARLVTLAGPGGVGKTRVALQAAHELAAEFADGVVFVDLAAVRSPELVPDAIAAALEVGEQPGRAPLDVVAEHLRDRGVLLVPDNFEHVAEAATDVARLLAAAEGLRVLATSRSPLGVYGEHRLDLAPLTLEDAVPLFVARARAAAPAFRPSAGVAAVCERLDRLPLGIELAAGRSADMSVDDMLSTLSALAVASAGPRDREPRQQTLAGAVAWSIDLLEPRLQAVFCRLATFVGGWPDDAPAAVADASADDLAGLERRNLVVRSADRWTMLETIREYAAARLGAGDFADDAHARHAAYFVRVAEAGDVALNEGGDQAAWLDRLEREHANLRAALGWATERGDGELALRLAVGLGRFWEWRGHVREGALWTERALALGAGGELRVRALLRASVFAHLRGDLGGAERLAQDLLDAARAHADPRLVASAMRKLATLAKDAGDESRAAALLEEALAASRSIGDEHGVSSSLMNLADVSLAVGDWARARSLSEEAIELARALGDPMRELVSSLNLALAATAEGSEAHARPALAAVLDLGDRAQYPAGLACALEAVAALEVRAGRPAEALRLVGAAARLLDESDTVLEAVERRLHEETLARAGETLGEDAVAAGLRTGRELDLPVVLDAARDALAAPAAAGRGAP